MPKKLKGSFIVLYKRKNVPPLQMAFFPKILLTMPDVEEFIKTGNNGEKFEKEDVQIYKVERIK